MFGFVSANYEELTQEQKDRYGSVYCGICRQIGLRSSPMARLGLSYDMAFLAILLMSLYEPEETSGKNSCHIHPVKRRPWVDSPCVEYAADLNVALAYYKALDDWADDRKPTARLLAEALKGPAQAIEARLPRQCDAIRSCIGQLSALEKAGSDNPDLPAGVFGQLMGELLVWQEDLWAPTLRALGFHLGRFIYLADAVVDYDRDARKRSYNPFLAMGGGKDPARWEQYLLLAMGSCTEQFEKLPLVQDKAILDNILYSGVWIRCRDKHREEDHRGSGSL